MIKVRFIKVVLLFVSRQEQPVPILARKQSSVIMLFLSLKHLSLSFYCLMKVAKVYGSTNTILISVIKGTCWYTAVAAIK